MRGILLITKANYALVMGFAFAIVSAFLPSVMSSFKSLIHTINVLAQIDTDKLSLTIVLDGLLSIDLLWIVVYLMFAFLIGTIGYKFEKKSVTELRLKEEELNNSRQEVVENSSYIVEAVQTLPPKDYLANFEESYITMRSTLIYLKNYVYEVHYEDSSSLETAISEAEEHVKFMLSVFAKLTKDWDTQGTIFDKNVEYRVNVMKFFEPQSALEKFESEEYKWIDSKRFFNFLNCKAIPLNIDGVLFVDPSLYVALKDNGYKDLVTKKPIGLPVTFEDSLHYDQNLPGAPKCFSSKQAQYIMSCQDGVHQEISKLKSIQDRMKTELQDYYGNNNFAQSIISFPLHDEMLNPFGVINIYRNKSDLAKRNEQDFMALMNPIVETISEAIEGLYCLKDERNYTDEDEHDCADEGEVEILTAVSS